MSIDCSKWELTGEYEAPRGRAHLCIGQVHSGTCGCRYKKHILRPRQEHLIEGSLFYALRQMRERPGEEWESYFGGQRRLLRWSESGDFDQKLLGENDWSLMTVDEYDLDATDWRPVPAQPKEGTREWAITQPEGRSLWLSGDRCCYYVRKETDCVWQYDMLTGRKVNMIHVSAMQPDGWSLCLHHGKPAEPVVGSQFWAQVCCRELGRQVKWTRDRYRWNGGFEYFSCDGLWKCGISTLFIDDARDIHQSGWSLYEPAPLTIEQRIEKLEKEVWG